MINNTALARSMLIYAICLPLAIFLGYLITDPLDRTNDITLTVVLFLLVLPLLLRWYHAWVIAIWNMAIVFAYLPGMLPGWMPVAGVGFVVAVGHYALNRERKFLHAPSVSWSLVVLGLVVAITAKFRGGIGFRAFGSEAVGAKRYLWIWMAILGYFVLISQPVPPQKRRFYTTLFLIGSVTMMLSFLNPYLGPLGPFFNMFFPSLQDPNQLSTPALQLNFEEFGELATGLVALGYALVARYGIEGTWDLRKFWRPFLFCGAFGASFFGGYRSLVIIVGFTLVFLFCFEGLLRSRFMPAVVLGFFLIGGLTVSFSDRMPLSVQRCLTLLPLKLDPMARLSAQGSSEWRLEIWRFLLPQIPQYLLLGKGLVFDANDMAMNLSLGGNQAGSDPGGQLTLASDYHNGPLSVIIPFGIWGCIAFLWFLVAAIKTLWANYKYGDPEIKKANTFLLSYFLAKTVLFFFVFGGLYGDLVVFVGIVGFSISLNNGVAQAVAAPVHPQVVFNRFRPLPAARPVAST
jgi:O-antigen ligase/polysaccharide polymerase Wzy-like membrane protein